MSYTMSIIASPMKQCVPRLLQLLSVARRLVMVAGLLPMARSKPHNRAATSIWQYVDLR